MRKFNKRNIHNIIYLFDENYVYCGEKKYYYDYIEKVVVVTNPYSEKIDCLFWYEEVYEVKCAIYLKREYFGYLCPIVFIISERSLIDLNDTISQLGKNLRQLHIDTNIK